MATLQLETKISPKLSQERTSYSNVESVLKPVLVSLKIFGVYFDPTPDKKELNDSGASWPTSTTLRVFSWLPSRLYCYIVLLVLWCNVARSLVGLFPIDEGLSLRVILDVWYLQCAINATIMVASCQRLRHLRAFYKHWDSLFENSTTIQIGCGFKSSTIYIGIALTIGWVFFVINLTTSYTFLFGNLQHSPLFVTSFCRPLPEHMITLILVAITQLFGAGAWVFPIVFFTILCRVLKIQFLQFGSCLKKQIDDAAGTIPSHFKELRCRYYQLCRAAEIVNGSFKWLLGLSFIVEVLLACFISYHLINTPTDVLTIFTNCFWLLTTLICILVLAISTSEVHDAAHSLLDDIFRMGTKDATTDQLGQLSLFVSQLTGTSIGFTAIDFFVITKEFLLTIGGLYLTYFFLLLQFKIT